jgi:hypothetical protein
VNYALNWALASKGVAPQGDAYRNLKEKELKKHNAAIPGWLWDLQQCHAINGFKLCLCTIFWLVLY